MVDELPPRGEEVTIGDQRYVKFGETYCQRIEQNGKAKYEVVEGAVNQARPNSSTSRATRILPNRAFPNLIHPDRP